MNHYLCDRCGKITLHNHLHDTAHGIAETHMVGTERFRCADCGYEIYANSQTGAYKFPFVLDVPVKRGVPVK